MNTFAALFKHKRRLAGLSQRQLAELVGVDFSYISKLENGHLAPTVATIEKLALVLGCPVDELLASASKLPRDVSAGLASEDAIRFVREASSMALSEEEWQKMVAALRRLRPNG